MVSVGLSLGRDIVRIILDMVLKFKNWSFVHV
jgi:hypothetical protein